jgi:hypothetical protein
VSSLGHADYAIIALVVISAAVSSLVSVDPARSARYAFYLCLNIFLSLLLQSNLALF